MARAIPYAHLDQLARAAFKRLGVRPGAQRRTLDGIRRSEEHQIQAVFVAWARLERTLREHPELDDLYAVPNYHLPAQNKTAAFWGAYFNEEGRKRGQLDLVLPHGRGGYHAAYFEAKAPGGRLTVEQKARVRALLAGGNKVYLCFSAAGLQQAAIAYLSMPPSICCHADAAESFA